ncbi:MAG TPA: hypothetical protein VIT85_07695 [Solirubrobacterales bacterium]
MTRRGKFTMVLLGVAVLAASAISLAAAAPSSTRLISTEGKIVPIPASIPHEEGDMVDSRILPDLRWLASHYPIYVSDGYSGPLPSGKHAGCNRCHTRNSDHYNGLALDIVPVGADSRCDRLWRPITRLARWAEPRQNRPAPPFRWVGYEGDAGHGCGHHLHLSWNHAPAREYTLAEWVEVLGSRPTMALPKQGEPAQRHINAPPGGIPKMETGGVEARRID